MSKLTIKNNSVKEANEPVAFGKAYQDFVGRCWRDTPDGKKPNYSVNAINFLLDCAHIANGTSVKGLPQQGFKLTKAGNVDIVGDCLHLCYNEVNGKKAVDIWLNPHTQKALVDLDGFNPEDPYSSTHKEFSARDYTADDFCEFIENLPNYKGESKTAESRKLTIRVHEAKETLQDRFGSFQDFVDYCDAKVHDKLVELLGEEQGDTCFREITQPELTYKDKRGHKLVHKNDNPTHLNVLQEWWKQNFAADDLDGCCDSLADGYAQDPKPIRIVTPRRGKDVTDKWKLQREAKKSEAADEQVEHGEECHLFIEDDPNYQVSFRSDNGHVYTFYVRADDPQDALDRAYHEFGVNYNMSIKGEAHSESDIPQGEEAVEVGTKYAPKVNVAVDPWDGKGVRVLYIPEYYLSYIVNNDPSGMEEEDIAECDKFVDRYVKKGYDMASVFPVCGPQGEWWDQNVQGDVLCSTTVD